MKTNDANASFEQLDLPTLRTVLECYEHLRRHGPTYLGEIVEGLAGDTSVDQMNRRIKRFEDAINEATSGREGQPEFQLFERRRGSKARIPDDGEVRREQLMAEVRTIIDGFDRIRYTSASLSQIEMSVAMSMSGLRFFLPRIQRRFEDIRVSAIHGKPQRLKSMIGDVDFVLTAIGEHDRARYPGDILVWSGKFQMGLLAPRGHWLERASLEELERWANGVRAGISIWDELARRKDVLKLVRDEPERDPAPPYPKVFREGKILIDRMGSTMVCQSLVAASAMTDKPNVLTVSFPQFLTASDASSMLVVNAGLDSVHFGLFRRMGEDSRERGDSSSERQDQIDKVKDYLVTELEALAHSSIGVKAGFSERGKHERFIYHLTYVDKEIVWTNAKLWWTLREIRGDHADSILINGGYSKQIKRHWYHFVFHGRVLTFVKSGRRSGHSHLSLFFHMQDEWAHDEYMVSAVLDNLDQLYNGDFVGIWTGVSAWCERGTADLSDSNSRRIHVRPLTGSVVVSVDPLELGALNQRVREYHAKAGVTDVLKEGTGLLPLESEGA